MKKSFLKRAMAAAIAVPVALTQTLLCTSFAADTTAAQTIDVNTFMNVVADPEVNAVVEFNRTGTDTRTGKQYSMWNVAMSNALTSVYGTTVDVDLAAIAEKVTSTNKYVEILKEVLSGSTNATAVVNSDNIVITADVDYLYALDAADVLADKISEAAGTKVELDIDDLAIKGEAVITINTGDLATGKTVDGTVAITIDGENKTVDGMIDYVEGELNKIKADVEAQLGGIELDAANDVFASYQSKLDKVREYKEKTKGFTYSGSDCNDILAQVKADYAGNAVADRLPNTISEAVEKDLVMNIFTEVMNQVTAAVGDKVTVDITLGDLATVAEAITDVTVSGGINAGVANGSAEGEYVDEEDLTALITYFEDLEAADGYTIVEESFTTYKVVTADGYADANTLTGAGTFDVVRYISYDVEVEEEETTEDETDPSETDATEPSETDATEPSETDATEPSQGETDPSETDSTEPSQDETDPSETDSTEPSQDETDPSETDSTEPSQGETDPSETDSTEPSQDETDPSETDSTEPSQDETDPSDAPTDPSDAPTDPSDVPTDPSDAPTDPSDAPTDPSDAPTDPSDEPDYDEVIEVVPLAANFYFSHDETVLTPEMLLESAILTETVDGEAAANGVDVLSKMSFGLTSAGPTEGLTPAMIFENRFFLDGYAEQSLYIYYTPENGEPVLISSTVAKAFVGVKGDANLNGEADAKDAAAVLVYAAEIGSGNVAATLTGEQQTLLENFAFFLADVDTEDKTHDPANLDSKDAAKINVFATIIGSGDTRPVAEIWDEIINGTPTVA